MQVPFGDGATPAPALRLVSVTRTFGATVAVHDLTLSLMPGTVHAVMGENGAGKSTVGKMAAGVIAPSSGIVQVAGESRSYRSARDAEADGVVLVPQELLLYDSLSVMENMFAGRPRPRRGAVLSGSAMRETAGSAFARLDLELDPGRIVGTLSPGTKQMVTIARALVNRARVLILDEPTAALDEWEARRLLGVVDGLRRDGVAIMYVSHRLPEVLAVADMVSVMRDGRLVATTRASDLDEEILVEQMLGREIHARERTRSGPDLDAPVVLAVRDLSRDGEFDGIDLDVRAGEIVGLAGIVGAGRSEVAQTIFGLRRATRGSVEVSGAPVTLSGARDAVRHGLAYLPEERQSQGLFSSLTVSENVASAVVPRITDAGIVRSSRVHDVVTVALRGMRLRGDLHDRVDALSGGNQQKVLLAKWLATRPRVVLLDEPTRGIDIGARSEIYQIIEALTEDGCAVLLISSDLQELMLLSDRVTVMREGRVVARFEGDELSERAVGRAALGVTP